MVHFPGLAPTALYIQTEVKRFSYSEINGSLNECFSPLLIAAYHVLHRLKVPRHSPSALSSLTIKFVLQQILVMTSVITNL